MGLIPAAVFLMKAKMKMLACRDFGASFKCSLVVEWQKLIRAFHYVLRVALARKTPKIFTFSANCGVKLFFFFFAPSFNFVASTGAASTKFKTK